MLIGIYSPCPRSGKTTIARRLCVKHGFTSWPFAFHLKLMVDTVLLPFYSDTERMDILHNRKEEKLTRMPHQPSFRHLCQTLGTEWGRQCVGPDFWVGLWEAGIKDELEAGRNFVVDDLRFANEAGKIRELGGQVWQVVRPSLMPDRAAMSHASEGELDGYTPDQRIVNFGPVGRLDDQVDFLMSSAPL